MKNIQILHNAYKIGDERCRKLFLSKIEYLTTALARYDGNGIYSIVTFQGEECSRRLYTRVLVDCEDYRFKQTLEEAVIKFVTEHTEH